MLLGSTKSELDRLLGKPVMSRAIFGFPGEKTWAYPWGDFEIIAGFLQDKVRYSAVKRRRGPNVSFSPAELAGVLALEAPASQWTVEIPAAPVKKTPEPRRKPGIADAPASYFSLVEKDAKVKDKVLREIRGWMPGNKPYAFFYQANLEGQPPLLVSEWGVHQALG